MYCQVTKWMGGWVNKYMTHGDKERIGFGMRQTWKIKRVNIC